MRYEGYRHLLTAVLALLPLAIALLAIVRQIETSQQLVIEKETESLLESRSVSGYSWPHLSRVKTDSLKKTNKALYHHAGHILIAK